MHLFRILQLTVFMKMCPNMKHVTLIEIPLWSQPVWCFYIILYEIMSASNAWIFFLSAELILKVPFFSFSHKDLGVTQSVHGNVYKVVNYKGQVTLCDYFCAVHQVADRKSLFTQKGPCTPKNCILYRIIQSNLTLRGHNLNIVNKHPRSWFLVLYGILDRSVIPKPIQV